MQVKGASWKGNTRLNDLLIDFVRNNQFVYEDSELSGVYFNN